MLNNYRRLQHKTKGLIPILSLLLIGLFWGMFFYQGLSLGEENPKKILAHSIDCLVAKATADPRDMILTSMPALAWQDTPEEMESPGRVLLSWLANIARVDFNPWGILRTQISLMEQVDQQGVTAIKVSPEMPDEEVEPVTTSNLSKEVLVGIYTTHTGETYTPTDGTDRLDGKQGGVVKVAKRIQKKLEEQYFMRVALSDKVHDARYATSYLESEKTARQMVADNPGMMAMLDIHRDAGTSREESLVEVKGKKTAPILIIIGSDARMPFPNWKENYKFACTLAERMNKLYPGLCQGVRVKEGRYNQFLHPGAILVEVGSDYNSLEEALTSSEMFTDALAQVINEKIEARKANQPVEQSVYDSAADKALEEEKKEANPLSINSTLDSVPESENTH